MGNIGSHVDLTSGRRDIKQNQRRQRHSGILRTMKRPRVVKELDLFESKHGCGLNVPFQGKRFETDVT